MGTVGDGPRGLRGEGVAAGSPARGHVPRSLSGRPNHEGGAGGSSIVLIWEVVSKTIRISGRTGERRSGEA